MLLLAQEAVAATAEPTFWTWIVGALASGALVLRVVQWVGDLIQARVVKPGQAELQAALDKLNAGVGSNLHIDDVLITMAYKLLPVVVASLTEETKQALADGKISAEERAAIAEKLWDHCQGVFRDDKAKYLEGYARKDGIAIMGILVELWAARRKRAK